MKSPCKISPRTPGLGHYLLLLSLLLSLITHLSLILLLQTRPQAEPAPQPTVIQLVDYPFTDTPPATTEKQPVYEIDQQPVLPQPDEPVVSERRAEHDQHVEQEQAPEGDDVRDQTAAAEAPTPQATPQPPPAEAVPPAAPTTKAQPPAVTTEGDRPDRRLPVESISPELTEEAVPLEQPPQLTREQLFPSPRILQDIAQGGQAERDRIRERDDVEIGDTIWLNLQHDRLISFFRRFHDRVERVWNYPTGAAQNGIEGTLELLIIVTREGELVDVDLTQTSGSDILDFEAIQAVYRAAPFGPLGRHYPHEELRIRAHFRYRISGRYIFGR